jgi:tRNA-specific adenosine deaminase 1
MTASGDAIAAAVLEQFERLPAKRKPAVRHNGLHEWVPLSGIVIEKNDQFTCVSLA